MLDDITERNQTDGALRDASQFNIEIISQAGEGIIVYDRNLRYVVWNRFMERMTGTLAKDVIGRNALDLFPHLSEQGVDKLLKRALNGETVTSPDYPFYSTLSEQNGWVVGTYSPHRNACGEIIGVIATLQDITERKRAEEKLLDSEKSLATIIEFLPDATFVIDLEGKVVAWNRAMEEMTGVSKNDMIGQSDHAYAVPFYGERRQQLLDLLDKDDREIASKYQYVQRKGDTIYAETFVPALHGGMGAYVWAMVGPIFDGHGNRAGAIESIRDITERKQTEEALRASHQILDGIINAIPVRVFWKDRDLVYLGCNAIFAHDAGIADPKDIIGKDDYQMGWRDQAELYRADDLQVIDSGRPKLLIEEPQTTPEGNTIVLLTSKLPLRSSKGKIIGVLGTYMDITERKRAEESLKKSEEKYREVFENAAVGIFQTSIQGRLLVANSALTKMFGFASSEEMMAEVVDLGAQLYARSEDRERLKRLLVEHDWVDNFEVEGRKKDGRSIWISINIHATRDHNGVILHLDGTGIDITERKRAEEALQESEHRHATTLASIGDAVIATDIGGKISFMNKVAEELTGWTLEESLARPAKAIFNIINEFTRQEVDDPITKVLENGAIVGLANHTILIRGDGTEVAIDDSGAPIKDRDGNITGVVLVFRDITERRRMEDALRIQNRTFSEVLNSLDALVYVVDMKTYEIVFINTYGQSIWGDIKGKICWQTIQEGQASPCEFCTNSQLIGPDGNPTEGVAWEFQNTVNKRWYDCRDKAIYWPDGRIVRMEIATDITEHKQAEGALRSSEMKFRTLYDSTGD